MFLGVPKYMNIFIGVNYVKRVCQMQIVQIVAFENGLELAIHKLFRFKVKLAVDFNNSGMALVLAK